jgi:hypothetical protein
MDISGLLAGQNTDGGWGYHKGSSWTEPTVFALLALSVAGCGETDAARRALVWLRTGQRADGGWSPRPDVAPSTWVTALPLLLPQSAAKGFQVGAAVKWLISEQGRESTLAERIRAFLRGGKQQVDTSQIGWPFYPETAAWVAPTAFTLLSLDRVTYRDDVRRRCNEARSYLLSRRCADGGWNHGGYRALGYDAGSYPETTGLALLALRGRNSAVLQPSLALATKLFGITQSCKGACWLALALLAHGRRISPELKQIRPPRSVIEQSLVVLVEAAAGGNNIFLYDNS